MARQSGVNNTIVLFTNGEWVGDATIEQYIECEVEALQRLVEKCENSYHVFKNLGRDDVLELLEEIEDMVAGNMEDQFYT